MASHVRITAKAILPAERVWDGHPMRPILAVLLVSAFLLPSVGAQGPVTAHDKAVRECKGHLYPEVPSPAPCGMFAESNWTVEECDTLSCTVRLETRTYAWAVHPGLMHLEVIAYKDNSGSACIGPQLVSERLEPVVPCGRICQRITVSFTASCTATRTERLEVAANQCAFFGVAHIFLYDEYVPVVGDSEGVMMWTYLCRDSGGAAFFHIIPRDE